MINKHTLTQRIFLTKQNTKIPKLDLLSIQKDSYQDFLNKGITQALKEISPVEDFTGRNWNLEFLVHRFDKPKYDPLTAIDKGVNYDVPIKVKTRLTNKQTGESIEEEIFLGDIPQMTSVGTFIINGIERAVVNQLVRSPGIFYSAKIEPSTGRMLYSGELRPLRGSWLEFDVNKNDVITVKIDRHRKFAATTFLRAAGMSSDKEILETFKSTQEDSKHQYITSTTSKDPTKSTEEALIEIYQKLRPGEPAVLDNAHQLFQNMFFSNRRYDLGDVGRYKLNKKLDMLENGPSDQILTLRDIVAIIKNLIKLQDKQGRTDDIDHLANRRIRRVGELVLSSAFQPGILRLERSIREKMSMAKTDTLVTPSSLVNPRPLVAMINDFFRRNRLSTILDQTNPLSEIDNLRRLSVMGRGGVTRERTSFSMRDINSSQYSRICPVRSPEGPNIGLVTYMALYAKIDQYGFLQAPYREVMPIKVGSKTKMKVTDKIIYISADDEEKYYITHTEVAIDKDGYIVDEWVPVRFNGDFKEASVTQVQLIDVVSRQVVGSSASLIPFLAHDEANRALMGTHMQCQAVPLVKPESPIVGTGMEVMVPEAMNRVVRARVPGKVIVVDANKVIIETTKQNINSLKEEKERLPEMVTVSGNKITYWLQKFKRSAQSTAYSQKPVVDVGQKISENDLIIDGPACDNGELALGKNLLIAYASFEGLGYEDGIIISDRLVKDDVLTSIHINEYETQVMDTKLGPEELTPDIPNVSEVDLANLDKDGIVVIGSEVGPNDILVGKIAPKGETELTAEERLLRAIFGEKAREVRDTSLRMPHGEQGTVVDVQILDRKEGDELEPGVRKIVKVKVSQMRKVVVGDKLAGRHGNKGVISRIIPAADMPYLSDGTPVDIIISPLSVLARMNLGQLLEAHLGWAAKKLGYKVALPVFEKIDENIISQELKKAGLPDDGKVQLYDGRTGELFKEKTVVGIGYILKLIHMVEDKTHARSTGPYSLVTQQPLGGKAQMGGQRLGEMEVWALEAHRAAYNLQEMLTIKSDDVVGRAKAFEAIVKGIDIPQSTVPESFKVLMKELNSLSLSIIPGGVIEQPLAAPEELNKTNVVPTAVVSDNTTGTTPTPATNDTKSTNNKTNDKDKKE